MILTWMLKEQNNVTWIELFESLQEQVVGNCEPCHEI